MKRWQQVTAVVLAVALGLIWVLVKVEQQKPKGSDDQQIRRLIAEGARAVQRRDTATLNRLVSNNYRDSAGLRAPQVRTQLSRVLAEADSVQVLISDQSVQVSVQPGAREAEASFTTRFSTRGERFSLPPFEGNIRLRLGKDPVRYFGVFPSSEWRVTAVEGYPHMLFE